MGGRTSFQSKWRILMLPLSDALTLYFSLVAAVSLSRLWVSGGSTLIFIALAFTPLIILWLTILWMLDLHDLRTIRELPSTVQNLLVTSFTIWILGSIYLSYLETWVPALHTHLFLTIVASFPILILVRRGWVKFWDFQLHNEKVFFLGDREHVRMLQEGLERLSPETGFAPVNDNWYEVDLVVADTQWVDEHWDEARGVFMSAVRHKKPIISFESFYESLLGKVSPAYASRPSWTLEFALHESKSPYMVFKRVTDIVISSLLLLMASPFLLLIALAIRIFDGAPVFYGQRRVGYMCREFTIWKFRTMRVSADTAGPFTSAQTAENLITPIGRWLRRFRMDELPQLWNVLKGDMSLVGPRPEWTSEVRLIEKNIPNYNLRHLVRPGITGWAQVYFRATNNFLDSAEKLHYDLYYLKYFSFALDLSILLKTIKRLFVRDSMVRRRRSLAARQQVDKNYWVSDLISVAATDPVVQKVRNRRIAVLAQVVAAIVLPRWFLDSR